MGKKCRLVVLAQARNDDVWAVGKRQIQSATINTFPGGPRWRSDRSRFVELHKLSDLFY